MKGNLSKKDIKILNSNKALVNLISRPNTSISKTIKYVKYELELKRLQAEILIYVKIENHR